jgi:hypothetical protein
MQDAQKLIDSVWEVIEQHKSVSDQVCAAWKEEAETQKSLVEECAAPETLERIQNLEVCLHDPHAQIPLCCELCLVECSYATVFGPLQACLGIQAVPCALRHTAAAVHCIVNVAESVICICEPHLIQHAGREREAQREGSERRSHAAAGHRGDQ